MSHTHKATDRLCLFFMERNNKVNITGLLATIRQRRLDGFENPFGLTKVWHSASASSSYDSGASACWHVAKTGNYPTQFLAQAAVVSSQSGASSFRLADSDDSLFRHVPEIIASQAAAAAPLTIPGNIITLWLLCPVLSHSSSGTSIPCMPSPPQSLKNMPNMT